ncbi:MAG: purine-nucleoside phosphorylase [Oscillospiraceae bacterium]|nr:purine-nucleoside phosphorylase [Oscillospiraceae bacterium]
MTPHNSAKLGEIAKTVLMPGDPLRSKYIAENYLDGAKLVNNIRGVQGYTGTYAGTPVSVMASGMGMPAMGIYSYELYKYYEVENILRIGTAGTFDPGLTVGSVILGATAYTNSNYGQRLRSEYAHTDASLPLLTLAESVAKERGIGAVTAKLFTTDVYYDDTDVKALFIKLGVSAVEMETYGLYLNALTAGRSALTICTISNSLLTGEEMDPALRETSLNDMITLALATAVRL